MLLPCALHRLAANIEDKLRQTVEMTLRDGKPGIIRLLKLLNVRYQSLM